MQFRRVVEDAGDSLASLAHPNQEKEKGRRSWEFSLGKVVSQLNYPTLILSDISANTRAFVSALLLRGIVELHQGTIRVTERGLGHRVVLDGDSVDRRDELMEFLTLLGELRQQGLHIETVVGNHEGFLLQFLWNEPVTKISIRDKGFEDRRTRAPLTEHIISPLEWAQALARWYFRNGGGATIHGLANRYSSHSHGSHLLNVPDEYREALEFCSVDIEIFEKARAVVRRSTRCREFVESLVPLYRDGSLLAVHAAAPPISHHAGLYCVRLAEQVNRIIRDPASLWRFSEGFNYDENQFNPSVSEEQWEQMPSSIVSDKGLHGQLIWARLPDDCCNDSSQLRNTYSFKDHWMEELSTSEGLELIVRGHDRVKYLGARNQFILRIGAMSVLNIEVGLDKDEAVGYTYIDTDGNGYAYKK